MKNCNLLLALFAIIFLGSCDKVENPVKPKIELDTTLFPGLWADYTFPTFVQNTNTNRNVMLEDYTGHRCPNCPAAATIAKDIETANPNRVFVSSVHAGPGGLTSFQKTRTDCGDLVSNPESEYCHEFYNNESVAYGTAFQSGFGFIGNPQGTVNRKEFTGASMFLFSTDWLARTNEILTENDLKINLQAQSNYYSSTNGLFLHVEIEFLDNLSGNNFNIVVALHENEREDWQDVSGTATEEYGHHNIFRGCIDGQAWGQSLSGDFTSGSKLYQDYSYQMPTGTSTSDYHLLIYVYDVDTYEILQVIKHTF